MTKNALIRISEEKWTKLVQLKAETHYRQAVGVKNRTRRVVAGHTSEPVCLDPAAASGENRKITCKLNYKLFENNKIYFIYLKY